MAGEPAASKSESPRRRSTVREPAPFLATGGSIIPSAAPEPAGETIASSKDAEPTTPHPEAAETVPQPRRAGWWAKRMLGDKG
jgi:ribonuclease E